MTMNQTANRVQQEDSGQFESFDLTVYLGPDAIPWISATSRVGAVHGIPRHNSSLPPLPDLLDMVYDYTDDIQFAELQPISEMSRILGELVFGDPAVLQLFQATRGVAADRGKQLLFRILASPHLAGLPWELLPDPAAARNDRRPYLTLGSDTHLVRQARGRTYPSRMNMLNAPLNLLLVLSSPTPQNETEDWLSFDIFEVKQNLLAELAPLEDAGLLCIDVVDRPSIDNLRRRIGAQRRGYHLFHYVGHAFPEGLILEDIAGYRENLSAAQLVELLRLCPDLRLAVFAGCETARSAADPSAVDTSTVVGWRDLLSLADYCVQEACPAVIGMQALLPFSTERVFTRFFYQALATGYSTAESLRLARGAIQADQRVGGDLLDWSVPALFVGSGEPGAIVPPPTAEPKAKPRTTGELILGLRQGTERFFGRDLPLRQVVDVMTGLAPERVLVVTGAAGVGKTSLVDRAREEVRKLVSHRLFVNFDRIAPDIVQAGNLLATGEMPDAGKLIKLDEDHALDGLCRLTNELLGYNGLQTRERNGWTVSEWWERIVEDMVQQKFVLVIDEVGALDRLQRGLLEKLLTHALTEYVEDRRKVVSETQLLRQELLDQLSGLQRVYERADGFTLSEVWERISIPEKVLQEMETLPDRLRREIAEVYGERLEHQVFALSRETQPVDAKDTEQRMPQKADLENLLPALRQLEAVRRSLGRALQVLANRRSQARIVITAAAPIRDFFNLTQDMVFEMRLAPITWAETWRWIRRNLPGLVRCGEDYLSRLWGRFGTRLDRWEELERLLIKEQKESIRRKGPWQQVEILMSLAETIIPSTPPRATVSTEQTARRGHRALRIAVAGPHLKGPAEIAEAITRVALEHGIGGRVVFDASDAGALATLIDKPSPFKDIDENTDLEAKILQWLESVIALQPDIILLDYGRREPIDALSKPMRSERTLFRNINYSTLLIAAGGNEPDKALVTTPSVYPEVLSVGPLDDNGRLRVYAEWHPQLSKPDLFMTDNLAATPLGMALSTETLLGSSMAAINAVATAALVWSLIPDLTPAGLGKLLLEAGQPVPGTETALALKRESAIALAGRRLVQQTLKDGGASLQTLSAITGLEGRVLSAILKQMIADKLVVRLATGRLERFQLTSQ